MLFNTGGCRGQEIKVKSKVYNKIISNEKLQREFCRRSDILLVFISVQKTKHPIEAHVWNMYGWKSRENWVKLPFYVK